MSEAAKMIERIIDENPKFLETLKDNGLEKSVNELLDVFISNLDELGIEVYLNIKSDKPPVFIHKSLGTSNVDMKRVKADIADICDCN